MPMWVEPPSDDEATVLIAQLLSGDPTATADIVLSYLDHLVAWLSNTYPSADEEDCITAAEDTLLSLFAQPNKYDPSRGSLTTYLHVAAAGDLKNIQRLHRRHSSRIVVLDSSSESVELHPEEGKYFRDEAADPALKFEERDRNKKAQVIIQDVKAGLMPSEEKVLELMLHGERRTQRYAEVLELLDQPAKEQFRQVKRVKDRLKKRVERAKIARGPEGDHE